MKRLNKGASEDKFVLEGVNLLREGHIQEVSDSELEYVSGGDGDDTASGKGRVVIKYNNLLELENMLQCIK